MRKPKIGNFRLNNLDKPVVQLDVRDGTVKCRYVMHLEIDGIVYVVDRADKLAMGLFIDAVGEGWDPDRWKEEIHREIEYLVQGLQKIGHLADELREEAEELREKIERRQKSKDYLREDIDDLKEKMEYLYFKNPEKWYRKIGYLRELEDEYYDLQELEYEYPEGLLEVSPWKSGEIRLSHGNTEEKIPVEEFKRRHKCKKNRRKLNIRKQ